MLLILWSFHVTLNGRMEKRREGGTTRKKPIQVVRVQVAGQCLMEPKVEMDFLRSTRLVESKERDAGLMAPLGT